MSDTLSNDAINTRTLNWCLFIFWQSDVQRVCMIVYLQYDYTYSISNVFLLIYEYGIKTS